MPLPPGGFLNDYVPFYLGPRSPMLYRISRHQPQFEIIYLLNNSERLRIDYVQMKTS